MAISARYNSLPRCCTWWLNSPASSPAAHYVDESMLQGHWHQAEAKDAERDATEEDEPEVKAHGQE